MLGSALMIVEGMYPGTRTIGRANRFLAILPVTNVFSGVIQKKNGKLFLAKKKFLYIFKIYQ